MFVQGISEFEDSSIFWKETGKCHFRMKHYSDAHICFKQANVLNHLDSEIWSFLALCDLYQVCEKRFSVLFERICEYVG